MFVELSRRVPLLTLGLGLLAAMASFVLGWRAFALGVLIGASLSAIHFGLLAYAVQRLEKGGVGPLRGIIRIAFVAFGLVFSIKLGKPVFFGALAALIGLRPLILLLVASGVFIHTVPSNGNDTSIDN